MNNEPEKERELTREEWQTLLKDTFQRFRLPYLPTVTLARGIQIDFCRGARVYIPPTANCKYHLQLVDLDNETVMYTGVLSPGDYFVSPKHYFIRYGVQITEYPSGRKVFQHKFDAEGAPVLIKFPVETIGDSLAWLGSAVRFQRKHNCKLFCRITKSVRDLVADKYPEITFVSDDDLAELAPYAAYTVAIFHNDPDKSETPIDYRQVPLHHYGDYILGTTHSEQPPMISRDRNAPRQIEEPYVAIACQASGGVKMWHHPTGWETVVAYLKDHGYRVIDVDGDYISGKVVQWNRIPRNAEDFTGRKPLKERAELISGADFFIGLGSGLSWLAWACGKPVVLISGFSETFEEFITPYRVSNPNVCHGCFNDVRCEFDHHDYMWCPHHRDTDRHWECSRAITPASVIRTIERIPEFQERQAMFLKNQQQETSK